MSLWDKLNAVKNFVTGGSAKVLLEFDQASLKKPFTVKVGAVIGNADISPKEVYIVIKGVERIEIKSTTHTSTGELSKLATTGSTLETTTYESTIIVASLSEPLRAGEAYEWKKEIQMPEKLNSTYFGTNVKHYYQIYAGLNTAGNDPTTSWKDLELF